MKSLLLFAVMVVVVPLGLYEVLLACIRNAGGATLMLGATSGTTTAALDTMIATLLLRVYLVVLVPPLCAFRLVRALVRSP